MLGKKSYNFFPVWEDKLLDLGEKRYFLLLPKINYCVAKLNLVLSTNYLLSILCRIQRDNKLNYSVHVLVGFVLWTASH